MRTIDEIIKIIKTGNRLIVSITPEEIDAVGYYCDRKHVMRQRQVIKLSRVLNAVRLYRDKIIEIENEPVEIEGGKKDEQRIYNRKKKAEAK